MKRTLFLDFGRRQLKNVDNLKADADELNNIAKKHTLSLRLLIRMVDFLDSFQRLQPLFNSNWPTPQPLYKMIDEHKRVIYFMNLYQSLSSSTSSSFSSILQNSNKNRHKKLFS